LRIAKMPKKVPMCNISGIKRSLSTSRLIEKLPRPTTFKSALESFS
jgi:hypothetical protein